MRTIGREIIRFRVIVLVSLIWFMVQFVRYVFPPLFDTFQHTFGVSNTETGLLFTLLMLSYSAVQIPAGVLGDRFGERFAILTGVGIFAIASVGAFLAPTFVLLTAAAALIGLGTGVHKTVAIPYLSKEYPERKGLALGVMDTIGQFGGVAAPLVVVIILASLLPWNSVFLLITATCVALGVAFYATAEYKSSRESNDSGSDDESGAPSALEYIDVLKDRTLLTFLVVATSFTFVWNGIASFYPLFLISEKGYSSDLAGIVFSILFVASLAQVATGELSDRLGRIRVAMLLVTIMTLGLLSVMVSSSLIVIVFSTVIMGIGLHGFRPVRDAYLMELIPSAAAGGTLGFIRSVMTVIGGLAPLIIGIISDLTGFLVAFLLLIGFLAIAAGGIGFLHQLDS